MTKIRINFNKKNYKTLLLEKSIMLMKDLVDVKIEVMIDNDILVWSNITNKWQNSTQIDREERKYVRKLKLDKLNVEKN